MILERFIKYVKIDTMSAEGAQETPSTKKQFDLANLLKKELKDLFDGKTNVNKIENKLSTRFNINKYNTRR